MSRDTADNTMEWVDLTKAEMKKIRISGFRKTDFCTQFTDCGECVHGTKGECGWCDADNKCAPAPLPCDTFATGCSAGKMHYVTADAGGANLGYVSANQIQLNSVINIQRGGCETCARTVRKKRIYYVVHCLCRDLRP